MKLKKIISSSLIVLMSLNCFICAYADDKIENYSQNYLSQDDKIPNFDMSNTVKYGDFTYDPDSGTITGYDGKSNEVVIPEEINGTKIKYLAGPGFRYGNMNITNVVFPEGFLAVYDAPFDRCSNVESLTFPKSIKYISPIMFPDGTNIKTVYCYKGTAADNTSLYKSDSLSFIYINDIDYSQKPSIDSSNLVKYGDFTYDPNSGTITGYDGKSNEVVIPEEINGTKIKYLAGPGFRYGNMNITNVVFPEGFLAVYDAPFDRCSNVESLTFPKSIKYISPIMFPDGTNIKTVYCYKGTAADNTSLYKSNLLSIYYFH